MIELNQELIRICNNQSMYEHGTSMQNIANRLYQEFISKFESDSYNENQKKVYENRKRALKEYIEKSYNEYLSIASRYVPITVAGLAKYPVQKQQKIADRMMNKEKEIFDKVEKFYKNTEKILKEQIPTEDIIQKYRNGYKEPISSDDPKAKEKLQAKLEYLEEKHQSYLEFNKKARKNGTEQLRPYVLTNSNQNIKSVKDRLKSLEKMDNLQMNNYYFNNGEVHFDKKDNRVKIFFDEIPDKDVREELKSHAYKWSPKNQCWQRKLTSGAIYMTKRMFADIGSLEIKKVHDYTKEDNLTM